MYSEALQIFKSPNGSNRKRLRQGNDKRFGIMENLYLAMWTSVISIILNNSEN